MKELIVDDSVFGNTAKVAHAIAAALHTSALPVGQVTPEMLTDLDMLVVGSPTRGFRPTEATTKLLHKLPQKQLAGVQVAAFDTRILFHTINSKALRFIVDKGGYAASTIAKAMEKKRGILIVQPAGFLVTGKQGPLKEEELDRSQAWANRFTSKLRLEPRDGTIRTFWRRCGCQTSRSHSSAMGAVSRQRSTLPFELWLHQLRFGNNVSKIDFQQGVHPITPGSMPWSHELFMSGVWPVIFAAIE